MIDPRLHSPAVARNRDAILEVLRGILPTRGLVLEIGSGSGEHAVHFAAALPRLTFQPSDTDPNALASIDAWTARRRLPNVNPAVALDARRTPRPVCRADAILCIDMLHVAPWAATEGLFYQAFDLLQPGAALYLYGPFLREGVGTTQSRLAFDARLRAQNSEWGLRDLAEVAAAAQANDFSAPDVLEMPGDNLSLTFRRI
jgi:SAM-dependent methyltransferase